MNTLGRIVDETLAENGLEKADVDWLVPHQANIRIITATAKKLRMSMDQVVVTVERHHLLIVEDNPDARQSLQELLQMNGHQVDVAEDGQRGIELALAQHPDTAFVDIGLPLVDGYEVARRLRAHFGATGIRLIALTGYGQPEDRAQALRAGFDVHLVKPVDLDTVNRTLASLSGPRKSA